MLVPFFLVLQEGIFLRTLKCTQNSDIFFYLLPDNLFKKVPKIWQKDVTFFDLKAKFNTFLKSFYLKTCSQKSRKIFPVKVKSRSKFISFSYFLLNFVRRERLDSDFHF